MSFTITVPEEITKMPDEELQDEIEALVAHEEAHVITSEQQTYLSNLRDELYKRVAVGGPYADYTGGER